MKVSTNASKVKVTPKMAHDLLERHLKLVEERGGGELNRNINDNLVTKYAKDMAEDKWHLNGETVKVAYTGRILDGQHRLWACVDHKVTFETMMVTGLDEDSFYTIDIGRSRRPSDFLTVDGVPNGAVVAAAARLIIGFRRGDIKNMHMLASHEIVSFAKANPRIAESAKAVQGINTIAPLSAAAAWHFLFAEKDHEAADRFVADLRDGIGLTKGDPVLALRERMIKNRASKAKLRARDIFVIGIRAWNDRRSGRARMMTKVTTATEDQEMRLPKVA